MDNSFLDITVLPYRSLSKKGFRYLMIIVAAIFFSIGIFFWIIGAWPVFGFLGIDVFLLYYAFKINYKNGEIFENLKLLKKNLHITRNFPSGKVQSWDLEPYWTKVEMSSSHSPTQNLIIKSRDKVVMIGSFLNFKDKKKLMKKINEALEKYKINNRT